MSDTKKTGSEHKGSPKYWLSLDQWRQDPEFLQQAKDEFQSSPLAENSGQGGWARREFLKLMGASMALSTFGCLRRPAQKIVPYVKRPAEIVPGRINYYSSSFVDAGMGFGLVVATREGRPIKAEGNVDHPVNGGAMSARAHAHLLALYDPERGTGPMKVDGGKGAALTWEKLDEEVVAALKQGGVAVLTGSLLSPSTKSVVNEFVRGSGAKHYVWDPMSLEANRQGQQDCYGQSVLPHLRLDKAKYILSVDADFLGTYLQPVEFNRHFGQGRKPGKDMNKLVVFESLMSLTGSNADERYRIRPSQQVDVVMGILHELIVGSKVSRYANDSSVTSVLSNYADVAGRLGIDPKVFTRVASDLWAYKGQSLVMAGGMTGQTAQAQGLQAAVNFLNTVLENDGQTINARGWTYTGYKGTSSDLTSLVQDMESGRVKTVIIAGVNPGYAAGAAGFAAAMSKATGIYIGDRIDETGALAKYVATSHHEMEDWNDMEVVSGVYSIQQPTIQPLNDTRSLGDSLMAWGKAAGWASFQGASNWYEYVRAYWKNSIHAQNRGTGIGREDFESFWYEVLQQGVFDTTSGSQSHSARSFDTRALKAAAKSDRAAAEFELVLYPTVGLLDGSLANVSWLQEFPDPVTKICWDNYLCVSPKDARNQKLHEGDVVKVTVGNKTVEAPVHIQPGQADGVLGLAVGYGRSKAGKVANGVGVNAYDLASYGSGGVVYAGLDAKMQKTDKHIDLANVQGHHSMEGRQIVVEATLDQYMENPAANIHKHKIFSMWSGHEYKGHKWGMAIDQNACTGCSACIIACQSENNIPVVGKQYVLKGREMHWLRVDRYFTGDPEDAGVVYQPLPCQHCDNAPCETVCPVAATTHTSEGINDMTYNRCVGTRYCANNCYYKVRRFNWFDYTKIEAPMHLALNPEVTQRARGVMEKCTFCIHRIKGAKHQARVDGREFKAEDVQVACQQSCPTKAIVFGDMNDPDSQVSKHFQDGRSYALLEEFMAAPAVRYQTRIRNTDQLKGGSDHGEGHH
ncbi:MAG: TAT-variant-translocated molybdopterin oxidoreductase [Bdellovibrionaceae bacterium]|nr:TAT-variant-translocated molybdopterin oxidoreductase [Bdellovibrionales bacterium]MCB9082919.1 TAT-variant-translocated molybdopterin oxidoreductase [Pseudobdellovibrionaceae bacterium]